MRRHARDETASTKRRYKAPRAWDTAYYRDTCKRYDGDGTWIRLATFKGRRGWKGRTPS